jgi:diguanylate cyclase (GGDEF)-like protein
MESLRDLVRPLRSLAPSELSPLGALTWQAAGVTLCSAFGVLAFVGTISTAELGGAAMALSGLALVAWTAAAACYWAFWVVARRSLGSIERCDDRLDDQLVAALDAIRMKAVVEMSPEWKPDLQDAVARLDRAFRRLDRTISDERRQISFARDLADALDIADTEPEVFRTAIRASHIQMPLTDFQLFVASLDHRGIDSVVEDAPSACSCPRASSCPALRKGRTLNFRPGTGLARCPQLLDDTSHAICAPVSAAGQTIAVAQVAWRGEVRPEVAESVNALAYALGARLGVVRTLEEREMQASTDPLTGLANRRAMNQTLSSLNDAQACYAVIACDLDHFKRLNDSHGHDEGDRCLKLFASVLNEVCRQTDLPCRPGGEEFTVILPDANAENAVRVAERIRARLAHASRATGRVFTVSMGVAAAPEHGMSYEEILVLADQALYQAKDSGRDRVCQVLDHSEGLAA